MPDPAPVDTKPWWSSKTLWLNAISFAIVVITAAVDTDLVKQNPELVLSFMALVNVLNAVLRFFTNKGLLGLLLLGLLIVTQAGAFAADPTIKFKNVVPGLPYEFVLNADGTATLTPIRVIVVDANPQPTPVPDPTPPLTIRGIAFRDAALKATADKGRDQTAVALAMLYSEIAKKTRTGEVPLADLGPVIATGQDRVLSILGAPPEAWKPVKDVMTKELTPALQEGPESCAKCLEAAAAGLEASVTKHGAIDREFLKKLIMDIILLILANLLK